MSDVQLQDDCHFSRWNLHQTGILHQVHVGQSKTNCSENSKPSEGKDLSTVYVHGKIVDCYVIFFARITNDFFLAYYNDIFFSVSLPSDMASDLAQLT